MVISTRQYLSLVKRGTPESLGQFNKEVERIESLILGAVPQYGSDQVQSDSITKIPQRYAEALDKIREKYNHQIRLYEEERAKCLMQIQHLPTRDQSQAVYLYVIEDQSWEQIAITRNTTFEAARALVLRGYQSYEEIYGKEQYIDDCLARAVTGKENSMI